MEAARINAESLRNQIAAAEKHLQDLKNQLAGLEPQEEASTLLSQPHEDRHLDVLGEGAWPLRQEEYNRYGRQMIIPSIGLQGW